MSLNPRTVADLEQAWLDPEVDLILCIRGGAGTSDILPDENGNGSTYPAAANAPPAPRRTLSLRAVG